MKMKPRNLLNCVFYTLCLIPLIPILKRGMKMKILKPRKGQLMRRGLVIHRVKRLKIRIRSGPRKVMMITLILTLMAYQMIVTKGNKGIFLWEKYTNISPKPRIMCKYRSKSKSEANESLAMLRIIRNSNLKHRACEGVDDDSEESFAKTKQKLNNRDNHSKYGNRVCKLM